MPDSPATHFRACNLCEAICGLEIRIEDGRVVSIKGDAQDHFSRGHMCPKAVALQDIQNDPDRLRQPMRRVGSDWEPMSWDDAIELVTSRLADICRRHGDDAIAVYQGNPGCHHFGVMTHAPNFLRHFKTRNFFSATSVDQLPLYLVTYLMYGHQYLVPIPDIDQTDYFLMLGANPLTSNGSLMTVPDVASRLKALRQRGGKLIVIDPRRTETAAVADAHHFIRPGTDAALLAAVLQTILAEGLAKCGRLEHMLDGFGEVAAALGVFTPERAAQVTGISAATIRNIARDFARAERGVCYGRIGTSAQAHGSLCQWLIQLLNIATGNLDRVGGALVTHPAWDPVATDATQGGFGRWASRVSGRPEVCGELPAAVMAEEMLTPGEGQVRALVAIAGNPVLSTPNGRQMDSALSGLEFMVAIDFYVNETTRHADVILPTTTTLEHGHYDILFNLFAVRNVARYNPAVLPRPEGSLHDWEVFQRLDDELCRRLDRPPRRWVSPEALLDRALQAGRYGTAGARLLTLERLKASPHGIDLGPLRPSFPKRLRTPRQRIQCAPQPLMAALRDAEAGLLTPGVAHELLLVGRRDVRSNNSWMHNYRRLVKGKERCQLLMHPADLARRSLADGQRVRVRSRVGSVEVVVAASSEMMPGVASLPHGWGHLREGTRLATAREHAGVSANDLTDHALCDPVTGNAAVNGVPITVEAL